ncbi:probable tyrosyl-DNA phosphodiesterase [Microplitis mediator]|uniref:probable tyrosyl-DNA phosphodiesterase n=1 Tax=Microplitis mediator TaxID=375433 RepID=UPI002552D702|nr:probable tyrosyl-DNA phosphodiesterase [Microplitis mediator]
MDSKKLCPFKEKCYRKNPIHFEEMSHPHLEKLLNGQLTGDINLPSDLEFDCPDRSELVDQLKVLQLTLRKKKTSENPSAVTETKQALKRVSEPSTSSATKKSKDSSSPRKTSSKESPAGKSIFDAFNSCTADKARIEIRNSAIERMKNAGQQIPHLEPMGQFDLKYALSAPYHLFLACVQKVPETWSQPYSVTFPEILDISLGTIEESLHFNFMVDVGWLCLQYLFAGQKADSQIFLGSRCDDLPLPSNIKTVKIETPTAFGTHHSKVSVLKYTNGGARVVISTANLYSDDWDNRTQAVWISPHLPKLTDGSNSSGEAPTGFKRDFIDYLREYKNPALEKWISLLQTLDFSSVNVCFVASVPGTHRNATRGRWGLRKLASILSEHADPPAEAAQWPIVAQASSIGSLGPSYDAWLTREFVPAMASLKSQGLRSAPNFKFVYPSINNFKDSFDMRVGCCCLPYSKRVHDKQPWLNKYLYQWKAGNKSRNRAIPHSKTYIRLSPDLKKVPWAVVTSGNLSKAAWGYGQTSTTILNYEVGVVFLPKFLFKAKTIPIKEQDDQGNPVFPLPYDLPLTPYASGDEPFVMEFFNV